MTHVITWGLLGRINGETQLWGWWTDWGWGVAGGQIAVDYRQQWANCYSEPWSSQWHITHRVRPLHLVGVDEHGENKAIMWWIDGLGILQSPASDGTSIDSSWTIHRVSDACCTQNCSWKAEISSSNLTGCLLHNFWVSESTGLYQCEDHGIKSSIFCFWMAAKK